MKIKEITSRSRRDFTAIYECEHCGYTHKGYGYDDTNFHQNAIPNRECPRCEKTAVDTSDAHTPLYPADQLV